jgi:hypothetical protein
MGKMALANNGQCPGEAGPWLGDSLRKPQATSRWFGPVIFFHLERSLPGPPPSILMLMLTVHLERSASAV